MIFRTEIKIPKSDFQIRLQDKIMLLGSCFAENIGKKLIENKFDAILNPFGILYNPLSIAKALERLSDGNHFTESDLVFKNNVYQSFMHHSRFSDHNRTACLERIGKSFSVAAKKMKTTDYFLITFGTAYAYRLKSTNELVVNCHKFPADYFVRERLDIRTIVEEWEQLLRRILLVNPNAKFIFSVSPIRHWKDGAHENQLSKSVLHLSIHELQNRFKNSVGYFCAYEILLDELRDYRFFEEDMMHPSATAVEYIWEKFTETHFTDAAKEFIGEWGKVLRMLMHRPFNENTDNCRAFRQQVLDRLLPLQRKYPHLDLKKETEKLQLQQQNKLTIE